VSAASNNPARKGGDFYFTSPSNVNRDWFTLTLGYILDGRRHRSRTPQTPGAAFASPADLIAFDLIQRAAGVRFKVSNDSIGMFDFSDYAVDMVDPNMGSQEKPATKVRDFSYCSQNDRRCLCTQTIRRRVQISA